LERGLWQKKMSKKFFGNENYGYHRRSGRTGLLGYGITGVLLGFANAGLIGVGSMILGMVIFYGGIAQFVAGLMDWKKCNTFGMVAYASYGLFWFSFGALPLSFPCLGSPRVPVGREQWLHI
jgi:succinate-acetate transporter protein